MISTSMQEDMDEVKMMMSCSKDSINESINSQEPIFPTWKLYDNPFYNNQQTNNLHLPISARKIAASLWDLTFFRPMMKTELDLAQARINELQAELQHERKARKRGETMNKRLAKELGEERRGREAVERVSEELARAISNDKAEIDKMKKEIEEERKMLRMAEIFREERVQMKLAEAKFFLEEKLLELQGNHKKEQQDEEEDHQVSENINSSANLSGKFSRLFIGEKSDNFNSVSGMSIRRRLSPEAENHHIKRGIKGFVEFPRVVRAIGSKNRHWGTKLECQKAQLRILLRQKSPIRSINHLIIS